MVLKLSSFGNENKNVKALALPPDSRVKLQLMTHAPVPFEISVYTAVGV